MGPCRTLVPLRALGLLMGVFSLAGLGAVVAAPAGARTDARIFVPQWTSTPTAPHTRFLFTFEDPSALAGLRDDEHLDDVVADTTTALDRARAVGAWARRQFAPTRPDPYPPLAAAVLLREIRAGHTGGFCAQYAALEVQGLAALGEISMYTSVYNHEVVSVYDDSDDHWFYYDPSHDVWATDAAGHTLSALELHRRLDDDSLGEVVWRSGEGHDAAWFADYANGPATLVAYWLENAWTTRQHNFTDIRRGLLFWCPLKTGCDVPDGATFSTDVVDFERIPVDAAAYRAKAAR